MNYRIVIILTGFSLLILFGYKEYVQITRIGEAIALNQIPCEEGGECRFRITHQDDRKNFTYAVNSRFTVILDERIYSPQKLRCDPEKIVEEQKEITTVKYPLFAKRFLAKSPGSCVLKNGNFGIIIDVMAN